MSQQISVELPVSAIEKITDNSVKISFEIPQNQKLNFDFLAGQYITLEAEIQGETIRRAYSICSNSAEKILSVAVKQIPEGKFSSFANETLKVGDVLRVFPPEGKFAYIPEIYSENLFLIVAGSGITPILSILKTALERTKAKIVLIYGNKTKDSTMFLTEIEELNQKFNERFFVHYIFSQSHEKNSFFGRIDSDILNYLINNKYKEFAPQRFYICGPQAMVEMAKKNLSENFDSKKIHTELFVVEPVIEKKYEGTTQITISLDNTQKSFLISREMPILENLLQHNIDVSYSCKGGVCSSCLAKITEGKAEMVKNQILSEDEIQKGYILTCQAYPTTDFLTLEY